MYDKNKKETVSAQATLRTFTTALRRRMISKYSILLVEP